MKLLVTGGAGFIGKNLCRTLLAGGNTVVAIDNLITSCRADLSELLTHPAFTFVQHDIVQPLPPLITEIRFDRMYHLACPTGVPNVTLLGEEMLLTSSIGTKNILDFARRIDAPLLFTSSSEVYGQPEVFPQSENYNGNVNPVGLRSPYEEGKRFSESLIMFYVRKYNLHANIVRVFNTYGPYMSPIDSRVIPKFIRQAIDNRPITIHGSGSQTRTFCYVDDLVNGLVTINNWGKIGEIYNLGGEKEISILKVAQMIQKIAGSKSPIKFTERPEHDHHRRLPDLSLIKHLSWAPKVSLKEGLRWTISWYTS